MLRLTLRSGRDGRFLARIIDRNGGAFVLDYGDPDTIDDVSRRVLRGGFQALVRGTWQTATPQHPEMVLLLAHYYAHQGMLVFLDEPSYAGRSETVEERLPSERPLGDDDDATDVTDLLSNQDAAMRNQSAQLTSLASEVPLLLPDIEEDDVPTELAPRPVQVEYDER